MLSSLKHHSRPLVYLYQIKMPIITYFLNNRSASVNHISQFNGPTFLQFIILILFKGYFTFLTFYSSYVCYGKQQQHKKKDLSIS